MKRTVLIFVAACLIAASTYAVAYRVNLNPSHRVGDQIDAYNGVAVYYNGAIGNVTERNISADGYNLGLKYQCVEFVKRYYYERFGHRMPQDRGNAIDFYAKGTASGSINVARDLLQFENGAGELPQVEDLVVFSPWLFNRYGHVAIVSAVGPDFVEVVQQNPGPFGASRERYALTHDNDRPKVDHSRLLGWLRRRQ